MKKILALALALCLLCLSAASLAEAQITSEETTLDLDGFSLTLGAGEVYALSEKVANSPYLIVYPFYSAGDTGSNYNVVWAGEPFEATPESAKEEAASSEEIIRQQLEESGFTMANFTVGDAYSAQLNGVDCIAIEITIDISAAGTTITVYEREFLLGSLGYVFTLSAASQEGLDTVTQKMAEALDIK